MDEKAQNKPTHRATLSSEQSTKVTLNEKVGKELSAEQPTKASGFADVASTLKNWRRLSVVFHALAKVAEPVGSFFEHRVFHGLGLLAKALQVGSARVAS